MGTRSVFPVPGHRQDMEDHVKGVYKAAPNRELSCTSALLFAADDKAIIKLLYHGWCLPSHHMMCC
jgi:hypothetical protein